MFQSCGAAPQPWFARFAAPVGFGDTKLDGVQRRREHRRQDAGTPDTSRTVLERKEARSAADRQPAARTMLVRHHVFPLQVACTTLPWMRVICCPPRTGPPHSAQMRPPQPGIDACREA